MVLLITCFLAINSSIAFSKPYLDNQQSIPIKRPINFLSLEESADTIFNMIQKVGGKPTVNEKRTTLKKNETLSSALKRIDFDNKNICDSKITFLDTINECLGTTNSCSGTRNAFLNQSIKFGIPHMGAGRLYTIC